MHWFHCLEKIRGKYHPRKRTGWWLHIELTSSVQSTPEKIFLVNYIFKLLKFNFNSSAKEPYVKAHSSVKGADKKYWSKDILKAAAKVNVMELMTGLYLEYHVNAKTPFEM